MKKLKSLKYGTFIVSTIGWLAIDLFSKYYLLNSDIRRVVFVDDFFYLTLQQNTGVAFGIQMGYLPQIIGSIIILGMLIYFGFKYFFPQKRNSFLNQLLLGIILGGALGNLVNRIQNNPDESMLYPLVKVREDLGQIFETTIDEEAVITLKIDVCDICQDYHATHVRIDLVNHSTTHYCPDCYEKMMTNKKASVPPEDQLLCNNASGCDKCQYEVECFE